MPEDELQKEYEAPIYIQVKDLGTQHIGLVIADILGSTQQGRVPLVAANVLVTEAVIESIKANAARLGDDGTELVEVRLKRRAETLTPRVKEILPAAKRRPLYDGLAKSLDSIKQQFNEQVTNPATALLDTEEKALSAIRKVKLNLDSSYRQALEQAVKDILENPEQSTIFACLEHYDNNTFGHSLRVFLMGTRLLAKLFHISPARFRENRRIVNYGVGLAFHDIGMLFVPEQIRQKTMRLQEDEVLQIRESVNRLGLDPQHLTTIMAVNDPRCTYRMSIQKQLVEAVTQLQEMVDAGVLSKQQYDSLKQFPSHSCFSENERQIMEKHPIWGWEIMHGSGFSSPHALDIVRHHHQRRNRLGYPDVQTELSMPAQVAAAVDVFDALISERPQRTIKAYDVAFGILDAMTRTDDGSVPQLDRQVFELFCASVEKYPVGSFVKIVGGTHDGDIAQVVSYSPYSMDTPSLVIFRDKQGMRMQTSIRITRKDYDNTFKIRGMPFTEKVCRDLMGEK